jgi:hypothetical protein
MDYRYLLVQLISMMPLQEGRGYSHFSGELEKNTASATSLPSSHLVPLLLPQV